MPYLPDSTARVPLPADSRLRANQLVALLLASAAYLGFAHATPRTHFGQLLALFGVAGGSYVWLLHTRLPLRWGLGAALAFRLLWLPATPALSDDFHRFRWDGLLTGSGTSPFAQTPRQLLQAPPLGVPLSVLRPLLAQLNSPDYYSVYPPVAQLLYGASARIFPASQAGFIGLVRGVLLLADGAVAGLLLWLLPRAGWPARRALVYLLHPLAIVEVAGNLHLEGLVVCWLLLAGALLLRGQLGLAGGALGLAVATKLLPLLVLPLLLRQLGWARFGRLAAVLAATLALLFWPLVSWSLLVHFSLSLNLYFQHFEFNAGLYYLLRALARHAVGYNPIAYLGPALAGASALLALGLARWWRHPTLAQLPQLLLLTLSGYFALSTVVHPWYLVPLVALSCFSPLRFALVWAGLVVLSYGAYQTVVYSENLVFVALEYLAVLTWAGTELYYRTPLLPRSAHLASALGRRGPILLP